MDEERIREFERALWVGGGDVYRRCVDPDCVMVVPEAPFLLVGDEAIAAVERTPRWEEVELSNLQIQRAPEGVIAIGYRADAKRGEERYTAYCTSTYRRIRDDHWKVIQHQQTVPVTI
jgi:hypothetical protein